MPLTIGHKPCFRRKILTTTADKRTPQRVRNELCFRHIQVESKTHIAGKFWRIRFSGSDLAGFTSPGFDDHIKVFFPSAEGETLALPQITDAGIVWPEGLRPQARDYTPLEFDGESSLTLDFYIHQQGVASDWAAQAQVGDKLIVGGPRGSLVVPTDYAFQLYVCDETGLPAFTRRQRDARAQALHLYAFTDEATGRDYLADTADVTTNWLGSGQMQKAQFSQLITRLDQIAIPTEDYFIWLTGEGEFVKALSDYFTSQRGLDSDFVRAVAYWHQK
ncbi:siderophore-interacting protein [Pantoea vagans]|uniref:siderophore-interacting protein n=1 Tax=Pantoea vagans TaxID=470934 RepID=UPI003D34C595